MDELSVQFLAQTTESIQKLIDVSTRIDERVKTCLQRQDEIERRFELLVESNVNLREHLAVIKSYDYVSDLDIIKKDLHLMEQQIVDVVKSSEGLESKWNTGIKYVVQTIWLIVGTWIVFKLGLTPPNLP